MAAEIPVFIDIDSAFAEAAKRVDSAIKPLEAKISNKQLKTGIVVEVDKKGVPKTVKELKEILNSTTISSSQLRVAMAQVRSEIEALDAAGKLKSSRGLSARARDLLATYSALEIKLRGGSVIDNLADSIARTGNAAEVAGGKAQTAVSGTNRGLAAQKDLLGSIIGSFSIYTAAFAGLRLIQNIRNVTAEFEMQRVALGGIIQDSTRAGRLFADIKAAAIQSPFEIKDLVSFTKQLSAYRIETDKLLDVTMRLADVSAGLGIDMSRLVLAYGQVRAASVLRGQELRQFTEAGIPLVDLLAKKFSQLRGEVVSTGEVFELISNRAVPFAMIEEIFKDMTNAGGIFYEMQLKQSETLKGQWMKLKDVFSIALDEMGRTSLVSDMMRAWLNIISGVVKEWESLAQVVNVAVWGYVSYRAAMKGLIPFYNMHRKSIARQVALEKQQQIEEIKLEAIGRNLTAAENKRIAALKKLTAEDYKRIYSMKSMSKAQAMLTFYHNQNNKEIVKAITQTGLLTKAEMKAIGQMNGFQLLLKVWGASIRTFFASIGTAIASFWPIAAVSAAISMIASLISAHREQVEAISKVDKAYQEQDLVIRGIETAYLRLKQAIAAVSDESKRAQMEASSFGEKLGYAQQIVEQLKKNGLGGDFDLSLLNDSNIDEFIGKWISQLDEANRASQEWGRSLAKTLTEAEGVFHILGDNLNTDIKDLTNSYVKLTTNKTYMNEVRRMRSWVENLEVTGKKYYDQLGALLGEDAKLAIATKRRNESEYQYQMRLITNYQKIQQFAQNDSMLLSGKARFFESMTDNLRKFNKDLDEVEYEFDKTWGALSEKDPITIKMAIDKMFAENAWEDWLKEAWIERLNGKYNLNLEITPSVATPNVARGMKSILTTDFPTLFTAQELENMNSVTEIGAAIEKKMSDAASAIESANKQANNYANSEAAISKVQEAQKRIQDELAKDEKDQNHDAIRDAYDVIDAITKQNEVYDTQIQKKKEAAAAEYELAKSAKERLMNENLSDLAKDIKQAFPELLADETPGSTKSNRFLISDEDLKNIHDGVDAYDLWAENMKAVADEKEKLDKAGVNEVTVMAEQAKIDAKRVELQSQLDAINEKIKNSNYEQVRAQYDSLRYAVESSTTEKDKLKAQDKLEKFLKQTNVAEAAVLFLERQRLLQELGIQNAALGAKQAIIDTFKSIDDAGKFWEEFGKRYNFTLKNNGPGGSQQDPWIMIFKNRMKFVQDFQKGVQRLEKYLGNLGSVDRERGIMEGRGLSLGFNGKDELDVRQMTGSREEVLKWYDDTIKKIQEKIGGLGGRTWADLGVQAILAKDTKSRTLKAWQELLADVFNARTDFDTSQMTKNFEDAFNKMKNELKQAEERRNFFNDLLDITGDKELSANLTFGIYGGDQITGVKEAIQQQLSDALASIGKDSKVKLSKGMKKAFDEMDFNYILSNMKAAGIPEEWQNILKEMAQDSRKYSGQMLKDFTKLVEKYGDTSQKIAVIDAKAAKDIKEVRDTLAESMKNVKLTPEQKKALQDQASAIIKALEGQRELDKFKAGEEYVRFFAEINTMTIEEVTLARTQLRQAFIAAFQAGSISADELRRNLRAVDEQFKKLNEDSSLLMAYMTGGIDGLSKRVTDYADTIQVLAGKMSKGQSLSESETSWMDSMIKIFGKSFGGEEMKGIKNLDGLITRLGGDTAAAGKAMGSMADGIGAAAGKASMVVAIIEAIVKAVNDLITSTQSLIDQLNETRSEDKKIGDWFKYVTDFNKYAVKGWNDLKSGNGFAVLADVAGSVISIFNNAQRDKVKRYNKEIENQQKTVKNLEREHNRLEKAMKDSFGTDYIKNQKAALENLTATAAAYQLMADKERAKGKSADKSKVQNYEEMKEQVEEQIRDMKDDIANFFAGTDVASAAKSFAEAWVEAYKSFSNTTGAIKEKFKEMVDNMVINSLAAAIVQKQLKTVFDMIDRLAKEGEELSEQDIAAIAAETEKKTELINAELTALMQRLAASGINMRGTGNNLTGIAKDISGASEQSINGLAAGINTQNFYMSYMPTISANVEAILAALTGEVTGTAARRAASASAQADSGVSTFGDETFRKQMERMDQNLAELCSLIKSVRTGRGTNTNTHYIATK